MTGPANPHPLTQVKVCPVMVDKFHWPMPLAQFTTFVNRIRPLALDATELRPVRTLSYSMLPLIVALCSSNRGAIPLNVFLIHPRSARLAAIASSIGTFFIYMKLLYWQLLFASVAASRVRWRQAFYHSSASNRATSSLDFMGWRRQEGLLTVSARDFNLPIVPRLISFWELVSWRSVHALDCTL